MTWSIIAAVKSSTQPSPLQQRFKAALDSLVEQARADRSVLAAILCGSLSHDAVWAKSDIDLVFVTVDDRNVELGDIALYADGVNVHAQLIPRTKFRQIVDGSLGNSFMHSYLRKGRLLYTHDPTIEVLCGTLGQLGQRDLQVQLMRATCGALSMSDKARKWFVTREDLEYASLWILYTATSLAQMEVISRGLLLDREVLPQALSLNPPFFKIVYTHVLNARKTKAGVAAALSAIDEFIAAHAPRAFAPIIEYFQEIGEARSCREIEDHFTRHFNAPGVTTACEYLADQGILGKASTTARLTRKSNVDVQELAFYAIGH
ncbi:MAG: hypothetical protein M3541_03150 [Acidobacteriota bacterium]|nr:hypothetical protein [Acidobacteriota bacterium]